MIVFLIYLHPLVTSSHLFFCAPVQGYPNGLAHTVSTSGDYNADISRYLLEQGAYAGMLASTGVGVGTGGGIIHVSSTINGQTRWEGSIRIATYSGVLSSSIMSRSAIPVVFFLILF